MKLVTFRRGDRTCAGALDADRAVDLERATGGRLPGDMLSLLHTGAEGLAAAKEAIRRGPRAEAIAGPGDYELLAPIPNPPKIVAVGMNFLDHAEEQNVHLDPWPQIFGKFPCTVIGPGAPVPLPGLGRGELDYEVELAFVVGASADGVMEDDAAAHIAGWTVVNDVSARDIQFRPGPSQLMLGKNFTGSTPMGPCIATADEVEDPYGLRMTTRLNGRLVQDSSTAQIVRRAEWLIAFLSRQFVLEVGDVVCMGTPKGVGHFRNPPLRMRPGDSVECEIEGIGVLRNPVVTGLRRPGAERYE